MHQKSRKTQDGHLRPAPEWVSGSLASVRVNPGELPRPLPCDGKRLRLYPHIELKHGFSSARRMASSGRANPPAGTWLPDRVEWQPDSGSRRGFEVGKSGLFRRRCKVPICCNDRSRVGRDDVNIVRKITSMCIASPSTVSRIDRRHADRPEKARTLSCRRVTKCDLYFRWRRSDAKSKSRLPLLRRRLDS